MHQIISNRRGLRLLMSDLSASSLPRTSLGGAKTCGRDASEGSKETRNERAPCLLCFPVCLSVSGLAHLPRLSWLLFTVTFSLCFPCAHLPTCLLLSSQQTPATPCQHMPFTRPCCPSCPLPPPLHLPSSHLHFQLPLQQILLIHLLLRPRLHWGPPRKS